MGVRLDRLRIVRILATGAGLAISAYLLQMHAAAQTPFCPAYGIISCASVLRSRYAELFGIPVPLYGVAWFAAMLLLPSPRRGALLRNLLAVVAGMGLLFVGYLVFAEIVLIGHICLWCTGVHFLALAAAAAAFVEMAGIRRSRPRAEAGPGNHSGTA